MNEKRESTIIQAALKEAGYDPKDPGVSQDAVVEALTVMVNKKCKVIRKLRAKAAEGAK